MNKIIFKVLCLTALVIGAVALSSLITYASMMSVFIFGMFDYAEYIALGVFTVSTACIVIANYRAVLNFVDKKVTQPPTIKSGDFTERDFF